MYRRHDPVGTRRLDDYVHPRQVLKCSVTCSGVRREAYLSSRLYGQAGGGVSQVTVPLAVANAQGTACPSRPSTTMSSAD